MIKGLCACAFAMIAVFAATAPSRQSAAEQPVADSCRPLHAKCDQGDQCCSGSCYVDNDEGKGIWRCGK